jgi:cob(I)alamin adenosyltransferase
MGDGFTWDTENPEQDKKTARNAFDIAKEKIMSGKYQMVILDEINYVLDYQFFPLEEFLQTLRNKPKDVHVVCTGRNAQEKLIELADLVTEMRLIKHPYDDQGIPAQKGIEF